MFSKRGEGVAEAPWGRGWTVTCFCRDNMGWGRSGAPVLGKGTEAVWPGPSKALRVVNPGRDEGRPVRPPTRNPERVCGGPPCRYARQRRAPPRPAHALRPPFRELHLGLRETPRPVSPFRPSRVPTRGSWPVPSPLSLCSVLFCVRGVSAVVRDRCRGPGSPTSGRRALHPARARGPRMEKPRSCLSAGPEPRLTMSHIG